MYTKLEKLRSTWKLELTPHFKMTPLLELTWLLELTPLLESTSPLLSFTEREWLCPNPENVQGTSDAPLEAGIRVEFILHVDSINRPDSFIGVDSIFSLHSIMRLSYRERQSLLL